MHWKCWNLQSLAEIAIKLAIASACCFFLANCSETSTSENLLETTLAPTAASKSEKEQKLSAFLKQDAAQNQSQQDSFKGFSQYGNDQVLGTPDSLASRGGGGEQANITLNLVGAPIPQAAKAVLGDTLHLNYSVDARIQGNVTLQTSKPVSRFQLMAMFQQLLRDNGAAMVGSSEGYRIIPLADAAKSVSPLSIGDSGAAEAGYGPQIIALRYVSANSLSEVTRSENRVLW